MRENLPHVSSDREGPASISGARGQTLMISKRPGALRRAGRRHMTTPEDAVSGPETLADVLALPPLDDDAGPVSLFQEINERRARVENAELLHHLRGL